jgi:hypothetical protein
MLAYSFIPGREISAKLKNSFNVKRLLPFEYKYYRSMIFKPVSGIGNSISLLITKILLPFSISERWRAFKYMLFNPDSISHRIGPEKKGIRIFLPFFLLKLLIFDIKRKRHKSV